jgi:hypothetical protein
MEKRMNETALNEAYANGVAHSVLFGILGAKFRMTYEGGKGYRYI